MTHPIRTPAEALEAAAIAAWNIHGGDRWTCGAAHESIRALSARIEPLPDDVAGLVARLRENVRLRDALGRIAKQRLTTEIPDDDLGIGDIEDGYDLCVMEARAAMKGDSHE